MSLIKNIVIIMLLYYYPELMIGILGLFFLFIGICFELSNE